MSLFTTIWFANSFANQLQTVPEPALLVLFGMAVLLVARRLRNSGGNTRSQATKHDVRVSVARPEPASARIAHETGLAEAGEAVT